MSVTDTNLSQCNEYRACTLHVPNVRLALVRLSSGVYIHTWTKSHIDEHGVNVRTGRHAYGLIAFIQRSPQIFNIILICMMHAQWLTAHSPKMFMFSTLDVCDCMCDWAFRSPHTNHHLVYEDVKKDLKPAIQNYKFVKHALMMKYNGHYCWLKT